MLHWITDVFPIVPMSLPIEVWLLRGAVAGLVIAIYVIALAPRWRTAATVIAGCLFGFVCFDVLWGLRRVDPREFEWIFTGWDGRWHMAGWQFFRRERWHFPPGYIDNMLHGAGTSIANTDSLPLVAFLLKPFDALLPADFQYFGIWFLLSAVLNGMFAGALVRTLPAPWPYQLVALAFFVRMSAVPDTDHAARAGFYWLTLASLWLYFRPADRSMARREVLAWLGIAAVAAWSNAYLAFTTLCLCAAATTRRLWADRTITAVMATAQLLAVFATVGGLWWLAGYFRLSEYGQIEGGGFGSVSMDLLSPFGAPRADNYLPQIPRGSGQAEGEHYLGAAGLALSAWAILASIWRRPSHATLERLLPLLLVCGFFTWVALSWTITVAGQPVLEMPHALYKLVTPFRASGRIFTPVKVAIVYLLFRLLASRLRPALAIAIIAAVFVVQMREQRRAFVEYQIVRRREATFVWSSSLDWDRWMPVLEGRRKIDLARGYDWSNDQKFAFAYLAARSGLATSGGEAARLDGAAVWRAREEAERRWKAGILDSDGVYIVPAGAAEEFARRHRVTCREVEEYQACVPSPSADLGGDGETREERAVPGGAGAGEERR